MPELTLKEKANGSEEKSKEEGVKEVVANYGSREVSAPVIIFWSREVFGSGNLFHFTKRRFILDAGIRHRRFRLPRRVSQAQDSL
jgi:hypothetical protein